MREREKELVSARCPESDASGAEMRPSSRARASPQGLNLK